MYVAGLEPFRAPAFRRFIVASSLGFCSLWMYVTVASWMLLELTSSATVTVLLLAAMTLPVPFAMLAAGALTVRIGPRTVLAVAFGVQSAAALGIALLALSGRSDVPVVLILAFMFGVADGFVIVSSQVLAGRSVAPELMSSAIALGLLGIGVGRILGAPIGGIVTAIAGPAIGLLIAATGFLGASLLVLTIHRIPGIGGGARVSLADLREGLAWVRTTRIALVVMGLGAVASLFLWSSLGLLAPITRDVLGGESGMLGIITAAGGIGSITAALTAGSMSRRFGAIALLVGAVVGGGVLLVAFGRLDFLPASAVVAALLSLTLVTVAATASLTLQSLAPLELRGRVVAVNGFVVFGLMPVALIAAGVLTDALGVRVVTTAMGVAAVTLAVAIGLSAFRRRAVPPDDGMAVPDAPLSDGIEAGRDVGVSCPGRTVALDPVEAARRAARSPDAVDRDRADAGRMRRSGSTAAASVSRH